MGRYKDELGYAIIEDPLHTWARGNRPRRPLIEAHCISLYAGAEAERLFLGSKDAGDGPDCEKARNCICSVGVRGAQFVGDDIWERYEDRLRSRTRTLIQLHRSKIERVANALIQQGHLSDEEVQAVLK